MSQMKFLSIQELRQPGCGIQDILGKDGRIVITSNGKPIGFTVGVDEDSFEETLDDWKRVRRLKHLRFIDKRLDAAEKAAADVHAEWIEEEAFWAETEASL